MDILLIMLGIPLAFVLFQLIAPYKPPKGIDLSKIEKIKNGMQGLRNLQYFGFSYL